MTHKDQTLIFKSKLIFKTTACVTLILYNSSINNELRHNIANIKIVPDVSVATNCHQCECLPDFLSIIKVQNKYKLTITMINTYLKVLFNVNSSYTVHFQNFQ